MKENRLEVIIGAAVLAVALGFVIFLYQSTGLSVSNSRHYELKADFRSADGIHVGTDVRLAGVKVGTVSALILNVETYRAEADLAIENNPPTTVALISKKDVTCAILSYFNALAPSIQLSS